MKKFFSTVPGRIVLVLALLLVIGGVVFVVTRNGKGKDAPEDATEETESVATSKTEKKKKKDKTEPVEEEDPIAITKYEPEDKEQYLKEASTIVTVIDAKDSTEVMTGTEVTGFLDERGFGGNEISYDYSINGDYVGETSVGADPSEKHPKYSTTFQTEQGDVWLIFVINGDIVASPISYLSESDREVQILVTESTQITSYDSVNNQFYEVIPKDSEVILMTVPKIDAETLSNLTSKEMDQL